MTILRLSVPLFDGGRRLTELRLAPAPASGGDLVIDSEVLLARIAGAAGISLAAARALPTIDLIAAALTLAAPAAKARRA
jgi:hypothetical protein